MRIEPFRMERMQSTYENYVDYNLSESGVHPMSLREVLREAGDPERLLETGLGYCQSNGSEELRGLIALFYEGARRENVLVTNGGSEANFASFWSLLEPGDRVAYMVPNYLQTRGLARAFAGRTDEFRLVRRSAGDGTRWALDIEGLRRAVTKKTRLILVTNPNNPTGSVLTGTEMDEVVKAARRVGAFIVADEIYRGAEVSGRTTPTFWGRYERVLITSGLSKAFGLPGLRIGWVIGPPRIVERIWSYRDYTTIAIGMLSDRLARLVMEPARREAILDRTRGIIRHNLPVIERWIQSHAEIFGYTPPEAGAIAFLRYDLPIASTPLAERLREDRSVLIVPGDQFGLPRHIRVGFGSQADYMLRGLERIDLTIQELREGRGRRRRGARGAGRAPERGKRVAAIRRVSPRRAARARP
ncbi:MAG TPA: aminotransferase class I/II-fold pyridoxal phosphate-dependent enzyme [Candidatus Polarisedimenticolia bacterium]|nr:aminotransferase class I/II-fold pyridoxal phosphate-dependent enzyme [Candidatus Polarisedimenticolia bacterium]